MRAGWVPVRMRESEFRWVDSRRLQVGPSEHAKAGRVKLAGAGASGGAQACLRDRAEWRCELGLQRMQEGLECQGEECG